MTPSEPGVPLTDQERQIIGLLLQGCDGPAIAGELNLPRRTLKTAFTRMFKKFGLTDRSKHRQVLLALKVSGLCTESV
jgi:DNA-binding NarL/FixJ family response regulator